MTPEKINVGLWHLARAVAIDPTLGGTSPDPKPIEAYLNSTYTQYHGPDDPGLKALKEQAKAAVNPPDGFKIKSQIEIAHDKELEFEKSNPQLALWMKIKGQLADQNGDQYFDSQLKSADLPPLKGTVVEARTGLPFQATDPGVERCYSPGSHPQIGFPADRETGGGHGDPVQGRADGLRQGSFHGDHGWREGRPRRPEGDSLYRSTCPPGASPKEEVASGQAAP